MHYNLPSKQGPRVCRTQCVLPPQRQFKQSAGVISDHKQLGSSVLGRRTEDLATGIRLCCGAVRSLVELIKVFCNGQLTQSRPNSVLLPNREYQVELASLVLSRILLLPRTGTSVSQ